MVEGGVYGIYVNGHLYYIGSTYDFEKRFKEHQAKLRADSRELYVYKLIQKGDIIEYKPLIKTREIVRTQRYRRYGACTYYIVLAYWKYSWQIIALQVS